MITKDGRARAAVLLLETVQRRRTTITTAVLRVGLPCRAERLQEADPVLDAAVHQFQQLGHQVLHAGCLQVAFEGLAALPALEALVSLPGASVSSAK
ncbi:hypothetical protein ACWDZ8_42855, partial [Streptomyces sp. NPDC003233]